MTGGGGGERVACHAAMTCLVDWYLVPPVR